jgi:tryptophan 2,3-dioxygenase
MDREKIRQLMAEPAKLDYELYLNTDALLRCQKPAEAMVNADELQFQIVHQIEELWMKLLVETLMDIDEHMAAARTNRVITLFGRAHRIMRLMTQQLELLETMSPKEYQQIRLQLGNGSGQESPGFRILLHIPGQLWPTFERHYLKGRTVREVYDTGYSHDDAYAVAEALMEFDELFQKFRSSHIQLIHRSIGLGAMSLKGRSVELLESGMRHRFFPELWTVRSEMTDAWGASYGRVRESLG